MKLTGKCKEDFDKYILDNVYMIYHGCPDFAIHAMAISFFDYANIFISIKYVDVDNQMELKKGFEASICFNRTQCSYRAVLERNEAVIQGIEHANKIYNEELTHQKIN